MCPPWTPNVWQWESCMVKWIRPLWSGRTVCCPRYTANMPRLAEVPYKERDGNSQPHPHLPRPSGCRGLHQPSLLWPVGQLSVWRTAMNVRPYTDYLFCDEFSFCLVVLGDEISLFQISICTVSYATWLISKRTMLIQFGNYWMKEISWTSKIGRGCRQSKFHWA